MSFQGENESGSTTARSYSVPHPTVSLLDLPQIQTTCLDIGICDSYGDALFPLVGKTNSGKYLKGIDGIFVNYIGFNLASLLVFIRL